MHRVQQVCIISLTINLYISISISLSLRYDMGHSRASCPEVSSGRAVRSERRQLIDLVNREEGNAQSREWFEYTKEFCEASGEDLEDLFAEGIDDES